MKYRLFYISAALFLIASMAVQFVSSYRRNMSNVQDNIDLKTEVAYEKILFELYDAYEVIDLMKQYVTKMIIKQKKQALKVCFFILCTPAECRTLLEYQALRPCICY